MDRTQNILFVISTKVRSTEWRNLPELKRIILSFVGLLFILLGQTSCKKSKEARKLEQELNDTKWEFYYAEDADGNDITAQVLADSVICECFEFYKTDKDATTYNAYISRCHGTFFDDYKANWGVFDWVKREKEKKKEGSENVPITNRWADFAFAIGNMGLENKSSLFYLRARNFEFEEDYIIDRIYKLELSGWRTDTILEYRYYKKVS